MKKFDIILSFAIIALVLVVVFNNLTTTHKEGNIEFKTAKPTMINHSNGSKVSPSQKYNLSEVYKNLNEDPTNYTVSPNYQKRTTNIATSPKSYVYSPINSTNYSKASNSGMYINNNTHYAYGRSGSALSNSSYSPNMIAMSATPLNLRKRIGDYEDEPFNDNTIKTNDRLNAPNTHPDDPGKAPIGDALIPMLLFAFGWIFFTRHRVK